MSRSYGSSATLCALKESSYGTKPTGNWEKFTFISADLSAEQGLITSELLGQGREPGAPLRDVIKDEGNIVVPVDVRDFGRWLQFLLGEPESTGIAASGSITFTKNPEEGQTITINGVTWTFHTASLASNLPGASYFNSSKEHSIQTGGELSATLNAFARALNAETDSKIKRATYSVENGNKLKIVHAKAGTIGNSFTLESKNANAVASGATLSGGVDIHTFVSGKSVLPSFALEIGHTNMSAYFVHTGCMLNSMTLSFQRSGSANATLNIIAQGETRYKTTQGGAVTSRAYKPFSQFNGRVLRNGEPLANITSAEFTYANGMEAIATIRSDGLIDGVDPSTVAVTGSIEARFADTLLLDDAIKNNAVELELGYRLFGADGDAFSLTWTFHEVYLPRPRIPISGPGGVQTTFNWQGAMSEKMGKSVTVVLKNDVSGYG